MTVRAAVAGVVAVCSCEPFTDDAVTDALEGALNAVRRGVLAADADGAFNARLVDGFNVAAGVLPSLEAGFSDGKPVLPRGSCLQLGQEAADESPSPVSLDRGEVVRGPPVPATDPVPGSAEPVVGALFGFGVVDFDDASAEADLGFAGDLRFRGWLGGAECGPDESAVDDADPGAATAIPGVLATAAPTPNATANAPTRPT